MPSAYTILFVLIAAVAAATWFIPAGAYARSPEGVPEAGTYHAVPAAPAGVGDVLQAAFAGFYDAVDVCMFILMVGGFLGVVMKTGAVDAGVAAVIRGLRGREQLLIPALMLLFGLGGTTYGMWEETMAFYPLLIPVFLAAGYDALVGISVILLGAGAGVLCSTVNPFATGIACGFAGVSLGEGIALRICMWLAFEGSAIWFVMGYAARVRRAPGAGRGQLPADPEKAPPLTAGRKWTLAAFAATFLVMIYGVIPFGEMGLPLPELGWWFPELSALFLTAAVVIGLAGGMGETVLAETFVAGASELLGVAFIIGISRGITVVMNEAGITDTVLHWGEEALAGTGAAAFTLLTYALYLPLSILIPSSSGLATLSVPILAPLGRFAGVGGGLVVTAFQAASGLVNLVTPTAAVVMGALALGRVGYDRWVKYVWKLLAWFLLLSVGFLLLGSALA
jgi:uncharacterized ion transporter superfamily protein YfcC